MKKKPTGNPLEKIIKLAEDLRDPKEGCPWDKEQNHSTLKKYLIEEAYEVLEAITLLEEGKEDLGYSLLKEELGDLLYQIVFHSQIAKEKGKFDFIDVIEFCVEKLVNRHPHVYGKDKVKSSKEVLEKWERRKTKEKKLFSSLPRDLPALLKAYRIGEKAKRVGLDWRSREDVFSKVEEEYKELKEAIKEGKKEKIEEELGDLLFSLSQFARHYDIDPEEALQKANKKFVDRFNLIEEDLKKARTPEEIDILWEKAKSKV